MKEFSPKSKPETQQANQECRRSTSHDGLSAEATASLYSALVDNRPETIAQRTLQALMDQSPQVQRQAQLQAKINNSTRMKAQAQLQAMIDNSPQQVAQRKQSACLFGKPVQRKRLEDEELLQGKMAPMQRQQELEEEELLQGKSETAQRQAVEDEELLQGKMEPVQRQGELEEEELIQGKFDPVQPQALEDEDLHKDRFAGSEVPMRHQGIEDGGENRTGMPDSLKGGLEQLSGLDLSGVRVHHNSAKPVQVNALAYAQGQNIHLAPGQEKHLPHEGWHAVQQMQGRVKPTMQTKGVSINDDEGLEREADVMGAKAMQMRRSGKSAFEFPLHYGLQRRRGLKPEKPERATEATSSPDIRIEFADTPPQRIETGERVVQRLFVFDPKTGRIIRIVIKRPTTGLQSSTRKETNYHTAAIIIAQDILATNLLGLTYREALDFISNVTNNIVTLPGFRLASEEVQKMIQGLINDIHIMDADAYYDEYQMNWAAYLEMLCEMYIQTLDQLDYTYHEKGAGEKGGAGEGTAAGKLREASLGADIDENVALEKALGLVDIRNYKPEAPGEAAPIITQYIQKIMIAYPIFAANDYLRTALIHRIAQQLELDSGDLFRLVDQGMTIPDLPGSEESSEAVDLHAPADWDGRSLPQEAFYKFILNKTRIFNIDGMRITIIKYSDENIQFRISPRGG